MKHPNPRLPAAALATLLAAGCTLEIHEVAPPSDAAPPDVGPDADCPDGGLWCDGACFDPATSPDHCGACGVACGPHGDCVLGLCVCDPDYDWCPGGCTRLDIDRANCGTCGVACAVGEACRRGACL
ncbi:MAG: hypothetical protein JXB32_04555 [Deltaproteobacteria bacterium]|nr:hypothetical protein [Deltaproteobacteria bacterium]